MPAYNEAENIEASVREWHAAVVERLSGAELIVVEDRSTDGTGAILERLAGELPRLNVLRPERNGGHGRAVRLGIDAATQAFVFQTDSDRQHEPADFWRLWEARGGHDFVFGIRARRADGPGRRIIGGTLRVVNLLLWGVWIADANCPFKLMRRAALRRVLAQVPEDSFVPMVMVSLLARKVRFSVLEIPVRHRPRRAGRGSLTGLATWSAVALVCVRQLLRLRLSWRTARAEK